MSKKPFLRMVPQGLLKDLHINDYVGVMTGIDFDYRLICNQFKILAEMVDVTNAM